MKFLVVVTPTSIYHSKHLGYLELFCIAVLQANPYQLSRVSLTTSLYEVLMILILNGTVNAEETICPKTYFPSEIQQW